MANRAKTPAPAESEETSSQVPDAIPAPTAVKALFFPASVQVPGHPPRRNAKVFVTAEGLYVYWSVPTPPESWDPDYFAPISWPQPKPPPPHMQRMGFTIATDYGNVTITTDGGCGCGDPLKHWTPRFAEAITAW